VSVRLHRRVTPVTQACLCCYTGVSVLLHRCFSVANYTGVLVLLHRRVCVVNYTGMSVLLHTVSVLLHRHVSVVTQVFQCCTERV